MKIKLFKNGGVYHRLGIKTTNVMGMQFYCYCHPHVTFGIPQYEILTNATLLSELCHECFPFKILVKIAAEREQSKPI
jgi:hypothetical protein